MHLHGFVLVVQGSYNSEHGRGINSFAQSFVVETDVAAGDGNFQLFAGFRDAVDGLGELPHDVRLFGIAEVEAVGCGHGSCSRTGDFAGGLGDGVHRSKARIEITPAAVAIERHGKPPLRALNSNYAGITCSGRVDRVRLHHVIVLLPYPALAADVGAGEKLLEMPREVGGGVEFDVLRPLARDGRLPARQRTFVDRSIVGQRLIRNFGYYLAVFEHAQYVVRCDFADFDCIESPLFEDTEDFVLAAFLRNQQHALLRFAEHDFVGSHAGFALRNAIEFNFDSNAAAGSHFAGRAGQAGRAHILDADDGAGLHGFETGFEQQLLEERIAYLHVGAFGFRGLAEFFAGHGGAVDAVTSGFCADVDYRIAFSGGPGVEDFIFSYQAEGECVDQRIARVARLEFGFAAEIGDSEAVAVGGDSTDHPLHDGVVAVNIFLRCGQGR